MVVLRRTGVVTARRRIAAAALLAASAAAIAGGGGGGGAAVFAAAEQHQPVGVAAEREGVAKATIGMKLDALLSRFDFSSEAGGGSGGRRSFRLSSTQMYALIVGLTALISFKLLGTPPEMTASSGAAAVTSRAKASQRAIGERRAAGTDTGTRKKKSGIGEGDGAGGDRGPEPKWHIFRYFNVGMAVAFAWSVVEFCTNASVYYYSSDYLLLFLLGWSVFLCYFFGFFGVSFVYPDVADAADHEDGGEEEEGSEELASEEDPKRSVLAG